MPDAMILAANSGNPALFESVARQLEAEAPGTYSVFKSHTRKNFADGEFKWKWGVSVAGRRAVILAATRTYEQWEELYQMISSARDARARELFILIVYYGSARQDRKDEPRVAVGVRMHAEMIEAIGVKGRTNVAVVDPHNVAATQCSFRIPCDIVYTRKLIIKYLRSQQGRWSYPTKRRGDHSPVLYSTDAGGTRMVGSYADRLGWLRGQGFKLRRRPDTSEEHKNFGPCRGLTVVELDDLIDTAGTVCGQAEYAKRSTRGAKRVVAVAVHGVFAGPAIERIGDSLVDEIVVTNSLPIDRQAIDYLESKGKSMTVLDITDILVQTIAASRGTGSISSLFE